MKKILIIFALLFLSAIVLVVARQPSQEQSPNQEALCLITVNGQVYNVAKLRSTHPGGDIYVCDTDMTETFNSKHGIDYGRLDQYLYTP